MARGIIGESGSDRAMDKMDKYMQRSRKEVVSGPKGLLEQLKAAYPDTWEEELKKMKAEHAAKKAAEGGV